MEYVEPIKMSDNERVEYRLRGDGSLRIDANTDIIGLEA